MIISVSKQWSSYFECILITAKVLGYKHEHSMRVQKHIYTLLSVVLLLASAVYIVLPRHAQAATTFTVTSTGDQSDTDLGDNLCDVGGGVCTLRAAIEQANATAGADTIEFNIVGLGLHTIQPLTALPNITDTVIIDGYTEPGSTANSAAFPLPMNGTLTVELDGSNLPLDSSTWGLRVNADDSVVRGLIINNFGNSGIIVDANGCVVQGNYVGTDETGMFDEGNGRGYALGSIANGIFTVAGANGMVLGGVNPEDRNIIAGNQAGDIFMGADNGTALNHSVIQGNYIGVGANGVKPLPSGYALGLGNAILMEGTHYTLIGGTDSGAGNIIGSSSEYGIGFREGVTNTTIQGNKIGTDYTGSQLMTHTLGTGNAQAGIHVGIVSNAGYTLKSHDILIGGTTASARNIISGNNNADSSYIAGISLNDGAYNVTVQGNYIGTTSSGLSTLPNGTGVLLDTSDPASYQQAYDNTIGGSSAGARNVISGNKGCGVYLNGPGVTNNTFRGNYIGLGADGSTMVSNGEDGVRILDGPQNNMFGGDAVGEGNTIVSSTGNDSSAGAGIIAYGSTSKNSFIGNSIYANAGLGIDLSPKGLTTNDLYDADSGPNDLLNYPEYTQVNEVGGDTVIKYRVDVPAGQYRVEFFSNTLADPSGNGEGQTYLGYENILSSGPGYVAHEYTLVGLTGAVNLALTATKIDEGSPTGFGVTSEFGGFAAPIADISIAKDIINPSEVARGAVIDYGLTMTNNGPDTFDLTQHSTLFGSPPLIVDFAPPDLVAANRLSAGPLQDSFFIDVGNSDLTCLWAGPASAGQYSGIITSTNYSVTLCWYTGTSTTELISGSSIFASISFTVSNESSLVFTNYAVTGTQSSDPDYAAITDIFNSGNDILEEYIASNGSINNFASAVYPVPVTPTQTTQANASNNGALGTTGQIMYSWQMLGVFLVSTGLLVRQWRRKRYAVYSLRA